MTGFFYNSVDTKNGSKDESPDCYRICFIDESIL